MARDSPAAFDLTAVGLVSGAAIAAQVALTRVLSITLWHHFAYLVVGVALLGFGIAGAWLTARGGALRSDDGPLRQVLSRRARWAAIASFVAVLASLVIRPNALELFRSAEVAFSLSLVIALSMVPFVGAGAVIGTALAAWPRAAGRVYAADLAGGGVAAALAVLSMSALGALGVLASTVLATALASLLFAPRSDARIRSAVTVVAIALAAALLLRSEDAWIAPAPTKELAQFHKPQHAIARIEHRAWTPHGRIDVSYPFVGPPLAAGDIAAVRPWWIRFVTQDGAAPTTLHHVPHDPGELTFLPTSTTAAVWVLRGARFAAGPSEAAPRVLVIGVGGGVDVMMALGYGAARVDGVEVNPAIVALHSEHFPDFTKIAGDPRVQLIVDEGRSHVRKTDARYDVIQLAGVDTFTALASGAYSLAEAHVYTLEAFEDYLARLAPGGCLSVSRLILDPPRETLRLAVTAREALAGRPSPRAHIAIVRGKTWSSLLVCESPIAAPALERLRAWTAEHGFAMAYDPASPDPDAPFWRALAGDEAARQSFIADYPYRITPATDEAPFFFDYFRWASLGRIAELQSESVYASAVPIGHGVQLLTLLLTVALAGAGILRPLRGRGLALPGRRAGGLYFACLGGAYLFVEVALIERLTFLLGHPTYALAVVLSAMLLSSGAGAALAERVVPRLGARRFGMLIVAALAGSYALSHWLVPALVALSGGARLAVALCLIAPLGLLLGMPFPHGIRALRTGREALIPWAFGVNAFVTVIAASVAPLMALEVGFSVLLLFAAALYAVAFAQWRRFDAVNTETG